ncbi:MAG: restriction endonuclease subunit S [Buchananella hordeovulneris]|nr:restriction endonuclease subunit S [Buchananella hordeovulneris]
MNRVEHLIEEMCPDGVPFKPLGEIATLVRGSGLPKSKFTETGTGCIHYGQIYTQYGTHTDITHSFTERSYAKTLTQVNPGDLIITNTSENIEDVCKAVAWLGEETIVTGGHATVIKHDLDPKFLSYYTQCPAFQAQKNKLAQGTKVIEVSAKNLAKIAVPIPPLEVQREIVEILDKFSRLEAELEARLTQFHAILGATFDTLVSQHPSSELGAVCHISSGSVFPQAHQGNTDPNLTPFFKVSDMNHPSNVDSMRVAANYIDEKTRDLLRAKIVPAGSTIFPKVGAAIGTNKKRLTTSAAIVDNNIMTLTPQTPLLPEYLYFWMLTRDLRKYSHDSGAVPSIRKSTMEHISIPVPSHELQSEISRKLRALSNVCHSLDSGLPAEIAARRQQYEYYRDRLLTFKELQ